MIRSLALTLLIPTVLLAQQPEPKAVRVVLPDQFDRQQDSAQFRGNVVVILYGDRQGMPANKELGERLHVHYHPSAKDMPPAKAHAAPVSALQGLPPGRTSPDVRMVPVACIGEVPRAVKRIVSNQVQKASPDVPVWLDFQGMMERTFRLEPGVPNLVVLDSQGRLRFRATGQLDAKTYARLIEVIDYLRSEAAGIQQ